MLITLHIDRLFSIVISLFFHNYNYSYLYHYFLRLRYLIVLINTTRKMLLIRKFVFQQKRLCLFKYTSYIIPTALYSLIILITSLTWKNKVAANTTHPYPPSGILGPSSGCALTIPSMTRVSSLLWVSPALITKSKFLYELSETKWPSLTHIFTRMFFRFLHLTTEAPQVNHFLFQRRTDYLPYKFILSVNGEYTSVYFKIINTFVRIVMNCDSILAIVK